MPCRVRLWFAEIWQPRWIDEVALFEIKRLRSLIHRRDKSGFTAAHRLRQHHGRIVAGLGDYAKDVVLHGDLISRGKPQTRPELPGGMSRDSEHLVEPKRTMLDRGEGEIESKQLRQRRWRPAQRRLAACQHYSGAGIDDNAGSATLQRDCPHQDGQCKRGYPRTSGEH